MDAPFSPQRSLYAYQRRIMPALLGWGVLSIAIGLVWWRRDDPWWRAVGIQWAAWGAIDSIIAAFGWRGAVRGATALATGTRTDAEHVKETRQFERVLWVNTGLDVCYVLGGALLIRANAAPVYADRRGHGAGVIAQGLFLLGFDLANALIVRARRLAGE